MKVYLKPLVMSLSLLSLASHSAFAQNDNDPIARQTRVLERQLAKVQLELQELKAQLPATHKKVKKPSAQTQAIMKTSDDADATADTITGPQNLPHFGTQYIGVDLDAPGQSFVTTGPYIGVPISYAGNNLIINSPSINEDVSLLNLRKNIRDRLRKMGMPPLADHSHLLLSGIIEADAGVKVPASGHSTSDIDVTSAGLDGYILGPSKWFSGLLSLAYDNDLGSHTGSYNNNSRNQNSRVFINKAFIVIGDLETMPFYSTIGQMYVPYGTYSTNMISSPMTKVIGRIKARSILGGFQMPGDDALYGATYIFRGDSRVGSVDRVNNGGVNMGYRFVKGAFSGDFGGGLVANMADSQGMQNTGGAPDFDGFGGLDGTGNERLKHRVPGLNLRGLLAVGQSLDFLGEYVGATNSFNPADMTYNGQAAKPQAINIEGVYTFTAFNRPTSIAAGYGKTKDALALGVPLARYSLTLNTSVWKDSLESLEFRHDINYPASSTATGSSVAAQSSPGKSSNVVTAQIDMYF